ncbi:WxL domain-containing protein [Levilactobacillus angrenensis]|uniref:WxL domain-containing protein n=1 Tax=Levilactobacillus angrenensis TaxID=2486020 RepID=A0ABW1UAN0_9LACO|nr:WxL domain-containing protein [Levilactobacillus angrenensis]
MFKKTLGFVTVAAAVLGLGLASGTTANAADTATTGVDANATSGKTTASVTLDSDTTTGVGGIKLTAVPTIKFATTTLTGAATTAKLDSMDNDLTVTNSGIDSATGWQVTLKSDPMTNGTDTLNGGKYTLSGTAFASKSTAEDVNDTTATTTPVTIETGASQSQKILSADAHQGIGIWNAGLNSENTAPSLSIPSQAVKGNYTQNLTWTLENTPA